MARRSNFPVRSCQPDPSYLAFFSLRFPTTPSHLDNLPTEILTTVFELLPRDGSRLALASTNKHLRDVLAPYIFSAIKLNSSTHERHEFEQLVNKYRPTITRLHFVASMPYGRPEDDIPATLPPNHRTHKRDILSSAVEKSDAATGVKSFMTDFARDALMGKLLPKVTTLCLSFDFEFNYEGDELDEDEETNVWDDPNPTSPEWSHNIYVFSEAETAEDVPKKEAKYPWRALMAQTWLALCQNKFITKLIVRDLIPRKTTTFDTEDWRGFLGRLETLELSVWGDSQEIGLAILEGYGDFVRKLDKYFLQHLTQVQRLLLIAYPDCPFGRASEDLPNQDVTFLDWALSREHLPHLRLLELCNVCINKKLADFILSRSATLHHVRLLDCHCESTSDFADAELISWAMFFTHIDHNKTQLKGLCVTYERGSDAAMLHDENRLKGKGEDMVFSYGDMDIEIGFRADDETIREKYEERMDLVAYHKLMDTIRQN
ncbi:hypothetical protein AAF712_013320 [Marasmius tenuissimus]|uniref:F-box domain-containing protein n=1 Tax=Marasmius tenuissimus TaxID=585030 RepID=A0ABR2ZEY7_9AGAR